MEIALPAFCSVKMDDVGYLPRLLPLSYLKVSEPVTFDGFWLDEV